MAPRFICPEILFRPSIVGIEVGVRKIEEICNDSIQKCDDIDIRKELYYNIALSGGTSMFNGLQERFEKEIKALAPKSMKQEVKIIASPDHLKGDLLLGLEDLFFLLFQNYLLESSIYVKNIIADMHKGVKTSSHLLLHKE